MAVKIFSCLPFGLEGRGVEVEADILQGLSAFSIVGLGDAAVQEAKERVRSAIKNSGFKYPQTKKIINLAPADLKKHGPQFDLPMAAGLLAASGQLDAGKFSSTLIIGELALDGNVRPVNGVLTMALFAKNNGWKNIVVPAGNFEEAALINDLEIIPINHLREITGNLLAQKSKKVHLPSTPGQTSTADAGSDCIDFSDIHGQDQAKRALTIAAAGGHHILLTGPPGTGKTMLAKAMPGILPPLTEAEMLEVMQIYSCAGLFAQTALKAGLITRRPFRQVHPTCSLLALTGGGTNLKPGEISLAHNGVLFLDEIAEFPRAHLESLRQPLEAREIYLSRSSGTLKYPANFTLVAGMNPCPCGYLSDPRQKCQCRPYQIIQYRKKLSGPILDRIDLTVEVPRQPVKIFRQTGQTTTAQILIEVSLARRIQKERLKLYGLATNSRMSAAALKTSVSLTADCKDFLYEAGEKLSLSGRNFHQVIKIARTIADLAGHTQIQLSEMAEALQYRPQIHASP